MTANEALQDIIENGIGLGTGDYVDIKALKMSAKALKKQVPQKVLYEDVGYDMYRNVNLYACICPSCGLYVIRFDDDDIECFDGDVKEMFHSIMVSHSYSGLDSYCNRCGKKLDWR